MYTQSIWAARQCRKRGIPALVIDHSTGYMMHGGLGGVAGAWYEHLACGIIRRCGFPSTAFREMYAAGCRILASRRRVPLPNAVDPTNWTG